MIDSASNMNIVSESSTINHNKVGMYYLIEEHCLPMKRQINSTTIARAVKRGASDELGNEAKKVMVDNHSFDKQASNVISKSFDQPKFVSAAVAASSARTNIQTIPEISDDELLAMTIEFEKNNPQ